MEYAKRYSPCLQREMEFKVYGWGGHPVINFPCQNGRFYDFENFHMTDVWAEYIDSGRAIVYSVDTIDGESWSDAWGDPRRRIGRHEQWYHYIVDELVPEIQGRYQAANGGAPCPGIMTFGCSMGAMHAGNFFFRRPDIFDKNLSLSGCYSARMSFGNYMDDLVYNNSPIDFLRNMPPDHPYIALYNSRQPIFCVGQGAWEDVLLASTRELAAVLEEKGIHAWVDIWGYDVNHDWDWWYKQTAYFLPFLL